MAPKGPGKTVTAGASARGASRSGGPAAMPSAAQSSGDAAVTVSSCAPAATINAKYAAELDAALQEIKSHHLFHDFVNQKPLQISQAPFTTSSFANAIEQSGVYRCAGNALWLKISTSTTLPIRPKRVAEIRQEHFKTPTEVFPINRMVLVGLVEENVKGEQGQYKIPANKFGELDMISPEEILHAPILHIADDIRNGVVEEDLKKWRTCLLNIPMMFKVSSCF